MMFSTFCLFFSALCPFETPMVQFTRPIEILEEESGLQQVDCIYAINLEKRPERWESIQKLASESDVHINRVKAVNGWELDPTIFKEISGEYPLRMTPGAIGCFLSHFSIIKDAIQRDFSCIWILEDDAVALENIKVIDELISELLSIDPNWDIIFTDRDYRKSSNEYVQSVGHDFRPDFEHEPISYYLSRRKISQNFSQIGQRFGTHSYILSRSGIEKIYHYLTHVYLWTAIDVDMHYVPGIREYCTNRDIVTNKIESTSDTTRNLSYR